MSTARSSSTAGLRDFDWNNKRANSVNKIQDRKTHHSRRCHDASVAAATGGLMMSPSTTTAVLKTAAYIRMMEQHIVWLYFTIESH
jgi:hypothetical protein